MDRINDLIAAIQLLEKKRADVFDIHPIWLMLLHAGNHLTKQLAEEIKREFYPQEAA